MRLVCRAMMNCGYCSRNTARFCHKITLEVLIFNRSLVLCGLSLEEMKTMRGGGPVVASGFFTNLKSGLFVSRMRERKGDCEFASCTLDLRTCHLPLRVSNTINFHRFQFAFRGSTLSPFPSAVARLRFSRSFAGGCQNRIKDDIKAF